MSSVNQVKQFRRSGARPAEMPTNSKQETFTYQFIPKNYLSEVGDYARFRILDLSETFVVFLNKQKFNEKGQGKGIGKIFTKEVDQSLTRKVDGNEEVIKEHDLSNVIVDKQNNKEIVKNPDSYTEDTPLSEGYPNTYTRVPVVIYEAMHRSEKGKVTDLEKTKDGQVIDINDSVMYLELSYGQMNDILALQNDANVDFEFDEETGVPWYDIIIERSAATGGDCWTVRGVFKDLDDKKKDDAHYGVDLDVVFGDKLDAIIEELEGPLSEAMTSDFMSASQVKFHTKNYTKGASTSAEVTRTSVASKPSNKRNVTVEEVEPDEDVSNNDEPEATEEAEETFKPRRGRRA